MLSFTSSLHDAVSSAAWQKRKPFHNKLAERACYLIIVGEKSAFRKISFSYSLRHWPGRSYLVEKGFKFILNSNLRPRNGFDPQNFRTKQGWRWCCCARSREKITAVESNWKIMLIPHPHKLGSSMFLNSSPSASAPWMECSNEEPEREKRLLPHFLRRVNLSNRRKKFLEAKTLLCREWKETLEVTQFSFSLHPRRKSRGRLLVASEEEFLFTSFS